MNSFLDFCEYIVDKASSGNNSDLWKLIFIDFYKNMIEPFAEEFNYEIPDKLKEYMEIIQGDYDPIISKSNTESENVSDSESEGSSES